MGRGMRWSSIGKGKYSAIPSRSEPPPSPGGDIELPSVRDGDEDGYDVYAVRPSRQSRKAVMLVVLAGAVVVVVPLVAVSTTNRTQSDQPSSPDVEAGIEFPSAVLFGNANADETPPPYDAHSDFLNKLGNIPSYWEEIQTNISSDNVSFSGITSWGPCYRPSSIDDWQEQVHLETLYRSSNDKIMYTTAPRGGEKTPQSSYYAGNTDNSHNPNLAGFCRPGYLIIGQAKCGTSSLYHYLTGHPRVLPAKKKQIDYYKYLSYMPMEWYLSHFPSAQTFLSRGALMTGESSPSYFPYPEVPHLIYERTRAESQPHPKIIAIVRDPISRSMSSYKYNYVEPALNMLMVRPNNPKANAALSNIKEGMSEEYYTEHHLFSFEDLVRAEINVLKLCLASGGLAEQKSREKYGPPNGIYANDFMHSTIQLVNSDEFCYDDSTSSDGIPLAQWADLIHQNPNKVIVGLDYHLIRSIVGRSLYSLFMSWWYARFSRDDIYVVCTEDLHFEPAETMLNVSLFLGLPEFDFTNVTNQGMYNVGFHQGYDTVTTWDDIEKVSESDNDKNDRGYANIGYNVDLSDELRMELIDFFLPYNEDLFRMTGKRCKWD
jgi:hypothetical protein